MMNKLKKLFSKIEKRKSSDDVMQIAGSIGPLIDKTALEIFTTHQEKLLSQPNTYIVPAVWGANMDGKLTETQHAIQHQILPVMNDILKLFSSSEFNDSQKFAVEYLVRGLFISKITYMIEMLKNENLRRNKIANGGHETLADIEPWGNA